MNQPMPQGNCEQPVLRIVHRPLSNSRILQFVSAGFEANSYAIRMGYSNDKTVVPRSVVHMFMMTIPGATPKTVGQQMGGKDRSTVIHGLKSMVIQYDTKQTFRKKVDWIRKQLAIPEEHFDLQIKRWRRT